MGWSGSAAQNQSVPLSPLAWSERAVRFRPPDDAGPGGSLPASGVWVARTLRAMSAQRTLALAVVAMMTGVAGVIVVAVASPRSFWTPDGRDLADSLQRAGGHDFAAYPCTRVGGGGWRCEIEDDPGSGPSDGYALQLGRDGCWRGARYGRDDEGVPWVPGGQPLRGCLQVLDFLWPP
jgi:hypothetical protein